MRLIDAEKFEELFYEQIELGANGFEAAEDALCDTPTVDAVPVVRCKDCKNRFTTHCPMHHEEQTYNENDGYDWIERDHTSDDGFCDEGELATDDNL